MRNDTAASDQLTALGDLCRGQRVKLTIVDLEKESRQQRDVMTTSEMLTTWLLRDPPALDDAKAAMEVKRSTCR